MAEENERIAVIETKIDSMKSQLDAISAMQTKMDAFFRLSERTADTVESEDFIKDRVWLRKARESSEAAAVKVKMTAIGTVTTLGLAALWAGIMFYIREDGK